MAADGGIKAPLAVVCGISGGMAADGGISGGSNWCGGIVAAWLHSGYAVGIHVALASAQSTPVEVEQGT